MESIQTQKWTTFLEVNHIGTFLKPTTRYKKSFIFACEGPNELYLYIDISKHLQFMIKSKNNQMCVWLQLHTFRSKYNIDSVLGKSIHFHVLDISTDRVQSYTAQTAQSFFYSTYIANSQKTVKRVHFLDLEFLLFFLNL